MDQQTEGRGSARDHQGKVTIVDFCRANNLKQTDVEKWTEEFVSGGTQALNADPKDIRAEHRKEADRFKQEIGGQSLEVHMLDKSRDL